MEISKNSLHKHPTGSDESHPQADTRSTGPGLSGVAETSMITLWARAAETSRHTPLFRDVKAVDIINKVDYDFKKFKKSWKTQTSVAIRTWILDTEISKHLRIYPDSIVINLGAGFDNRFWRMDNGSIIWYEIDLPPVIELKRRFSSETERYRFIDKSVLDFRWIENIASGRRPVMIIAEGLLMYMDASEIMTLFDNLGKNFPGSHMFIELLAPAVVGYRYHDTDNIMEIDFKWSLLQGRDLEAIHNKLQFIEEWCVLDFFRERWNWIGICANIPIFRNYFGEKIVHLKIK